MTQPTNEKAIPPIVPVGGGQTAQGQWQAVVYRTSDGWTCLEIMGGPGGTPAARAPMACSASATESGPPDQGALVTGGTASTARPRQRAARRRTRAAGHRRPGASTGRGSGHQGVRRPGPARPHPETSRPPRCPGRQRWSRPSSDPRRNAAASACRHPRAHPSPVASHADRQEDADDRRPRSAHRPRAAQPRRAARPALPAQRRPGRPARGRRDAGRGRDARGSGAIDETPPTTRSRAAAAVTSRR